MSYVESGHRCLQVTGAIARAIRVAFSAGQVAAAGLNTLGIGLTRVATFAANEPVDVIEYSSGGEIEMTAAGAITQGALVYTAASGKISATAASTSFKVGIAMEAATADGDIIPVQCLVDLVAQS